MISSFLFAAVALTALASVYDLKTGHIPNWLTLGGLAAGLVAHAVAGYVRGGPHGAAMAALGALGGALVCGAGPAIVFAVGGIGGGDVKLFAAVGALCQVLRGLQAEYWTFVLALVVLPGYLAYRGVLWRTLASSLSLLMNAFRSRARRRPVPSEAMIWFRFAPAICAGTVMTAVLYR